MRANLGTGVPRPPRILFLAEGNPEDPSASGSGTPASVVAHLRALGAEVVTADVDLYGAARYAAMAATWAPRRARWVAKYHLAPAPFRRRSARAGAAVARARPDVTLQYGGSYGVPAGAGVPSFLYCDSHTLLSSREPRSWGSNLTPGQLRAAVACQRAVYERAAGIFTFSEYVRASFVRDFGIPADRVETVHAGPNIDVARLDSAPRDASWPAGPPTVLFVGREFERKGGPVLLEAFRGVRGRVPDARLQIVGPRDLTLDEPGVEVLGYLPKSDPAAAARLQAAYEAADVFCLPTRFEPFGIVVLEAMFNGLPVVGARTWAMPEMVAEGETGYVVERDDAPALADRLARLLTDRDAARRMGEAGRRRAHARFTWSAVAAAMLARIERALPR